MKINRRGYFHIFLKFANYEIKHKQMLSECLQNKQMTIKINSYLHSINSY